MSIQVQLCTFLFLLSFATGCSNDSGMNNMEEDNMEQLPAFIEPSSSQLHFHSLRETQTLLATVFNADSQAVVGPDLAWSVADTSVLSLFPRDHRSVQVTSKTNGSTVITLSTARLTASVEVFIQQIPADVQAFPETPALEFPGDTLTISAIAVDAFNHPLTNIDFTWSSASPSIFDISSSGLVTATGLGLGHAVATHDSLSFEVPVEVLGNTHFLNGQVRLRYDLDLPLNATPPYPAMVFIHGSGEVTRQQLAPFAAPFVASGIAVLRYDKRGVGESTGDYFTVGPTNSDVNLPILASDAVEAVALLKAMPAIKTGSIGLIANSQGGWIAPLAAAESEDVAFMVMWSGTTVSVGLEIYYSNLADGTTTPLDNIYPQLEGFMGIAGYDPIPVLEHLDIPSLWLLGEIDRSIPTRLDSTNIIRLQSEGKPYEFIMYPSANHELRDTRTNRFVDLWGDTAAWLTTLGFLP